MNSRPCWPRACCPPKPSWRPEHQATLLTNRSMTSPMRVLLEQTLQGLPDDASLEQAMERLLLLAKIDQGLNDLETGDRVAHQEVRSRFNL